MTQILCLDVGITTGYAILDNTMVVHECGTTEFLKESAPAFFLRLSKQYTIDYVLVEYPLLTPNNAYYKKMLQIVADIKTCIDYHRWKEVPIKPSEWKTTPAAHYPIDPPGLPIHTKDAIRMGVFDLTYRKHFAS